MLSATFVPVAGTSCAYGSPIAIAPGVSGAAVELVFISPGNDLRHARLIGTGWTSPALIDASRGYNHVGLASF
jgi:hypothetical protein